MVSDRLSHLQSEVKCYYEQLAGKETAKRLAEEAEKVRIQQQIDELKKELGKFEREYWTRWRMEIVGLTIPEADAETLATGMLQEVEILEIEPQVQGNAELMQVLHEIKVMTRRLKPLLHKQNRPAPIQE